MVTVKIISIEEIPKTRRGKMFLFFLVLAAISLTLMLLYPSLLTGIAFAVIFVATMMDMFIGGKELDKRPRVIEMLKDFLNPLIKDLDSKKRAINKSLQSGGFIKPIQSPLEPKYEFAHKDVLGKRHDSWIRGKVKDYNLLAKDIYDDILPEFKQAIREFIKQQFPDDIGIINKKMEFFVDNVVNNSSSPVVNVGEVYEFWNEHIEEFLEIRNMPASQEHINEIERYLYDARVVVVDLMVKSEELKKNHTINSGIDEGKIMIKEEKKYPRGLI